MLSFLRNKSYVGLDIGTATINAVQLERQAEGWRVVRSIALPTPPDAVRDGVVTDPDAVGAVIKQALREGRISASSAVIAVSGSNVIVRSISIPKMPEATLRKSIKYEAGRYIPSSTEDSYIEFEILGDVDEEKMSILIAAAPREIVESRMDACDKAGLEVEVVDIEAFAMYRSLIETGADQTLLHETIALVDFGAATTNVSVISKGTFAMTRSIPQAGRTLTEALKGYFKLDEGDAEQGKLQLDLSVLLQEEEVVENPPLRVVQPHVDELIREVRRSLNYYQSQQTEQGQADPVTRVILSGGGAKMGGLAPYFEHKLGLPVTCAGIYSTNIFHSDSASDPGYDLSVASGLAMRALAKAA